MAIEKFLKDHRLLSLYHENCQKGLENASKVWKDLLKNDLREKAGIAEREAELFITSEFCHQLFNHYLKQMYGYYFEMGYVKSEPYETEATEELKPLINKIGDEMFSFFIKNISTDVFKNIVGPIAKSYFTHAFEDGQAFAGKMNQINEPPKEVSGTDIESHFKKTITEDHFAKLIQKVGGRPERLIDSLKEIYRYAYHYGKNYSRGEKVNFSQVGADKRQMMSNLSANFHVDLDDLGMAIFKVGFDYGSNHTEPEDDPRYIQPPYYLVHLDDKDYKFYSMLDQTAKPQDIFEQFLLYSFRDHLKELNEQKSTIRYTETIQNRAAFQKLITDRSWASRFVTRYLIRAYFHFLYISYFYPSYSVHDREAVKVVEKYQKIVKDLEQELTSKGYPSDVIQFHVKFTQELAGKGKELRDDSTCELMDILFGKNQGYDDDAGILRLEMFLSANTFGF